MHTARLNAKQCCSPSFLYDFFLCLFSPRFLREACLIIPPPPSSSSCFVPHERKKLEEWLLRRGRRRRKREVLEAVIYLRPSVRLPNPGGRRHPCALTTGRTAKTPVRSFVHRQKGGFCSARGSRKRRKRRGPPPGEGGLFLLVFCCRRRKARSSKPPSSTCPSESPTLPTFKTPSSLSPDKKRQETLLWKKGKTEERDLPHRQAGKLRKRKGGRESCQAGFFRHSDAPRNVGRTGQH